MALTEYQYLKKYGDKAFEKKSEEHFKSHRDTPNGRNPHFWNKPYDQEAEDTYRANFDKIFPNSPGNEF